MGVVALAPVGAGLCAGPQAVVCGVVAVVAVVVTAVAVQRADDAASTDLSTDAVTRDNCASCCKRLVVISRRLSPQAARHIVDAQASGRPRVLTYEPAGAAARRRASLAGIPTRPGMDRDEYPPAAFREGGAGASVRHIPLADNRSAGGQIAAQIRGATPGCKITMTVGP